MNIYIGDLGLAQLDVVYTIDYPTLSEASLHHNESQADCNYTITKFKGKQVITGQD